MPTVRGSSYYAASGNPQTQIPLPVVANSGDAVVIWITDEQACTISGAGGTWAAIANDSPNISTIWCGQNLTGGSKTIILHNDDGNTSWVVAVVAGCPPTGAVRAAGAIASNNVS